MGIIGNMKTGFKVGAALGLFLAIIIIAYVFVTHEDKSSNNSSVSSDQQSQPRTAGLSHILTTKAQAVSFVQNYRGVNNDGITLDTALTNYISDNFGSGTWGLGEALATNQWLALKPDSSHALWRVEYIAYIQHDLHIWEWEINATSNELYPQDNSAQVILDLVNH